PAVDARHHDVEQDEIGRLVGDRLECLVCAFGLADGVTLDLEVDAHVFAKANVVVDDKHERPARLPGRAGPVDERLEVPTAIAPVTTGRVEGGDPALVGPFPDRRLRDTEEFRRLPKRQPFRLAGRGTAVGGGSWITAHGLNLPKVVPI